MIRFLLIVSADQPPYPAGEFIAAVYPFVCFSATHSTPRNVFYGLGAGLKLLELIAYSRIQRIQFPVESVLFFVLPYAF